VLLSVVDGREDTRLSGFALRSPSPHADIPARTRSTMGRGLKPIFVNRSPKVKAKKATTKEDRVTHDQNRQRRRPQETSSLTRRKGASNGPRRSTRRRDHVANYYKLKTHRRGSRPSQIAHPLTP